MNTLLSLFDYTGTWPAPFARRGWNVIQVDQKFGHDVLDIEDAGTALEWFADVNGILAAPPCRTMTRASAQYWAKHDRTGQTAHAKKLINQVQRLADLFKPSDPDYYRESGKPFFWGLENPPGRLPDEVPLLTKDFWAIYPNDPFYFDPWEYAGYLDLSDSDHNELDRIRRKDAKGVTREEALFVIDCNAYTKKTIIYGEFRPPVKKKPIEPVRCCKQGSPLQMFGGDSEQTKEIRSTTPMGFAEAFFQANKDYQAPIFKTKQSRLF